jgi:HEAT repeat protein
VTTEIYAPPVDKLLSYGDPTKKDKLGMWPDYVAEFGFGEGHIPNLIKLATNRELSEAETESAEVWGPLHAWRTLGQLKAEAAIEPLLQLLGQDDDWASTEVPEVYGMIGPKAIPALSAFLEDPDQEMFARSEAATSLEKIGETYPESRAEAVAALSHALETGAENDPELNAYIVSYLIELGAAEAAPVIERAYAAEQVDTEIAGSWGRAQVELGLAKAGRPRQASANGSPQAGRSRSVRRRSGGVVPAPSSAEKAKAKTKRKMEKASRKKNRKR